jgi:hypothetical protein
MSRYAKYSALLVILAAAAGAAPGDIVASFKVPSLTLNGPRGLAFDGVDEYAVADNRGPNQVKILLFSFDGENASVEGEFNCPVDVYWALDLAWRPGAPGRIYIADDLQTPESRAKVIVLNAETGSLINKFDGPFPAGTHVNGLSWDGTYLYASSYDSPRVYRLTRDGSVVDSFTTPHAQNHGLAFGGGNLWVVSGRPNYDARAYTPAGALAAHFSFKVDNEYVGGACVGRPAFETLFVSTYTGEQYVYEISTDPFEYEVPIVGPASLGRVKALFH